MMNNNKQSRRFSKFLMLLVVFMSILELNAQAPVYLGEDVVFYLSDSLCVVRGEYHFVNPASVSVKERKYYPFSVSDAKPFPDEIIVLSMETDKHLPLLGYKSGILFSLVMEPKSETTLHVEYWQAADSNAFDYVLPTAQRWARTLKWVNYEIHVPDHIQLDYCSLPLDTSWQEIETTVFSFYRKNYRPQQRLELKWGLNSE